MSWEKNSGRNGQKSAIGTSEKIKTKMFISLNDTKADKFHFIL